MRHPEQIRIYGKFIFKYLPNQEMYVLEGNNEDSGIAGLLLDFGVKIPCGKTKRSCLDAWLENNKEFGSFEEMRLWLEIAGI